MVPAGTTRQVKAQCSAKIRGLDSSTTYRILLHAARAEGIGPARLPDFLGLEPGGELALLGQEELDASVLEASLRDQVTQQSGVSVWSDLETERILLAAARVGQHVFAQQVLANCGSRCVFCGLRPASFGATRMLLAGHIKPWKDSSPVERLDPRNGLAACPAHDVAFDTGMLTVNGGLRIHLARQLADATKTDPLARQYYGRPPLREVGIFLPEGAHPPARKYLDWHCQKIFVNGSASVTEGSCGTASSVCTSTTVTCHRKIRILDRCAARLSGTD